MAVQRAFLDDRQWRKFIKSSTSNLKKSHKALQVAYATKGFSDIIKHFKGEQGPKGRWQKSQRAIRESGKTLQDTGNLRRSFLPTNFKPAGRNAILIFNNASYSGIHDRGDASKNIPQREFMYFSDRAMTVMSKIFMSIVFK